MKIRIQTRFKLAWSAFWLKNYFEIIEPLHISDTLKPDDVCDNNRRVTKCTNKIKYCVSDTTVEMKIDLGDHDHYHVCQACADKAIWTNSKEEMK